jgi:poly(hydroxyalkanoate) depolymerase family esterase
MIDNFGLQAGMMAAMRQMRTGGLHEATATIQRTLRGFSSDVTAKAPAANEEFIEGSFTVETEDASLSTGDTRVQQKHERTWDSSKGSRAWGRENQSFCKTVRQPETIPKQTPKQEPAGQFLSGSYSNSAGTRAYKLYIPSSYHGQTLPLIVMLHGCTQNPDDFATGTRMNSLAEEHHCFVVYPEQTSAGNMNKCWNWFEASHQQCERGEPSIIAGLTRDIIKNYAVDPRRVYVAGLSAGGAMAAIMGRTYPNLYAAIGVHSGLPYAVAQDMPSAFAAMNQMGSPLGSKRKNSSVVGERFVPTIVFHGDSDKTVHPRNGDEVIAQCAAIYSCNSLDIEGAKEPQVTLRRGQIPNGRAYTRIVHHDIDGQTLLEQWRIDGAGHAWSGGSSRGSYTDPKGPNASREMIRFFYEHVLT